MIMYDSGLIDGLAKALDPLLTKIMPNLKDKEAKKYISSNIAATPKGLKKCEDKIMKKNMNIEYLQRNNY